MKTVLADYWRVENLVVNLGDYVTDLLIRKMGYEFVPYVRAKAQGVLTDESTCMFIIGTLFDHFWFDRVKHKKVIWGCGWWGDKDFDLARVKSESSVHLVRGPVTRDALGLPSDFPIGDPALLLSRLWPMDKIADVGVIYVPHFNSRSNLPARTLETLGADTFVDIACARAEFWDRVQMIVNADFVLTSSLHAAIIAQSYGRPWALVNPPGAIHDKPVKWRDWFASLGLPQDTGFSSDINLAKSWWDRIGVRGKTPDLDRIFNSFPHASIP